MNNNKKEEKMSTKRVSYLEGSSPEGPSYSQLRALSVSENGSTLCTRPPALPGETLSHPIMPAGAQAPSAHGDRRSRHRNASPSAGSGRMVNTSCESFVFVFYFSTNSGAVAVPVLEPTWGGVPRDRGEARMLRSASCHIQSIP